MESSSLTGRQQPDTSAADVIGVGSSTTGRCDGTEAVLDIRLPVNGVESSPCGLRDGSGELAELCDRVYGNGLPISPDQQGCELPPKSSPRNDANERGGFGGKGSGAGARLRLPRSWQAGAFVLPPRWLWGFFRKFRGIGEGLFPAYPSFIVVFWSFIASFIGARLVPFFLSLALTSGVLIFGTIDSPFHLPPPFPPTLPPSMFAGIALCAFLAFNTSMQRTLSPYPTSTSSSTTETGQQQQASFMIGSFGATAVLIFGTIDSPLSQPRNVVLGSAVSAVIGALIAEIFAIGGLAFPNTSWLWLQCGLAVSLSIVAMQLLRIVHPPGGASALIAVMSPPSLRCHGFFVLTPVLLGVCIMLTVALFVNNIARQYPLYWWRPVILDIPVPEGSTHHSAVTAGEAYHTIQHLHAVHSPVHHASSQLPSQQPSQPPSQLLPLCLPSSDAQRVHAVHSPVQPSVQPLVQPAVQPPVHHGMGHAAGHRNSNSSSSSSAREHGIHVTAGEAYHTIPHIHAVHSPVHHAMPHQPLGLHSTSDAATAGGVLHRVGNTHPLPALSQHVHPQQSSAHAVQSGTDAEEDGSASRVHGGTAYIQGGRARAVTCNDAGYACTQQGTQTATAAEALAAELTFRGGPFRHVSNSAVRHVSVPPLSHQQHRDKDKQQVEQQPQPFSGKESTATLHGTIIQRALNN
ncbi:unnamed protein product [Closterium sp. NIES-64]|nr:unnamed protein product [Closterium sp. NIES-64]